MPAAPCESYVCVSALVVFPWCLDEVISGSPRLLRPFVEEARYAAEHRNYYWEVLRGVEGDTAKVDLSPVTKPYPSKGAQFNDEAKSDRGKNFGRVARGNLMTDFITALQEQPISGIPAKHWQAFLRIFAEGVETSLVERKLASMRDEAERAGLTASSLNAFDKIQEGLRDLLSKT